MDELMIGEDSWVLSEGEFISSGQPKNLAPNKNPARQSEFVRMFDIERFKSS